MKNSKCILDYFKVQTANLPCPACGTPLPKAKLNLHLDTECSSSVSSSKTLDKTSPKNSLNSPYKSNIEKVSVKSQNNSKMPAYAKTSKANASKSGRLSLKHQKINKLGDASNKKSSLFSRMKPVNEAVEVITLEDDSLPSEVDGKNEPPLNEMECKNSCPTNEEVNKNPTISIELNNELVSAPNLNSKQLSDFHLAEVDNVHDSEKIENMRKSVEVEYVHESVKTDCVHELGNTENVHKSVEVEYVHEILKTDSVHQSAKIDSVHQSAKIDSVHQSAKIDSVHQSAKLDSVHKLRKIYSTHKSVKIDNVVHEPGEIDDTHESVEKDNTYELVKMDNTHESEKNDNIHETVKTNISVCKSVNFKKRDSTKSKKLSRTNKITAESKGILPTVTNNSIENDTISDLKNDKLSNNSSNSLAKTSMIDKSLGDSDVNTDAIAVLKDVEDSMEADSNVFTEDGESTEQTEKYSPYYIANFKYILNAVLNDDFNKILFNDEDMAFVKAFETSSDAAQKLYVRLFQRKYKWLRLDKINYPNISKDMKSVLDELVAIGLVDAGAENIDLNTSLDLLSLSEARIVAKQYKLNLSGKSKTDISHLLLKHCKEHKSVFFCNGKNSISNMMLKKVKDVLGACYRISVLPKRLFSRILMLFSLPTISEDDDDAAGGQQLQLLTLLQVNKGELTFPNYKINRQMMIFTERDELIRYEEAKQLENDIMNAVESRNMELAKDLYMSAREEFEEQLASSFVERPASLPSYLKKYSSFHIYVRCMTQGVEILQRLRQYKEAVELLKRLLSQKVFAQDYRGRWYDRLALNLEMHLKQREEALEAIAEGIKDENVRKGHRHSLLTRGLRILKYVKAEDELKNEIQEAASVIEAPKVVIRGRLFPRNILGRRNVFISSSAVSDEDDITVLGVEQLAIEHYKNEGFPEGIHGEGSTFHCLYGLLFWDLIYDGEIPDAFISPYQTHPLDLNHDSFFKRREKQILSHLETLRSSTLEELKDIVRSTWEAHFGESSLVFWDRFTDVEHILGLVSCMGNNLLCGICERLARDFRFSRSGIPDLVVWNPETLQVKIVEVKGPGDKLSTKQILWLDYLLKLGAQAEVCHIEAVGSKKLRKE